MVDLVLSVIALPVRKAGARYGRAEELRLRDSPHAHEPAIAPPGDADAIRIHRRCFQNFVDPRENIAQIAVAEIPHVGPREFLTLAHASSWIGIKHEITGRRQKGLVIPRGRPMRGQHPGRAAVDRDN